MSRMSRLKITAIGSTLGLLVAGGLVAGLAGPAAADAAHHGQQAGHTNQDGMSGHDWMAHGHFLLNAKLAPSVPTDPTMFGVPAGGIPWVLKAGRAQLSSTGEVTVRVVGLVDPKTGVNPVPGIAATVYCGGVSAGHTTPVAFPSSGTVTFRGSVTLPSFCPAPSVLLSPASGAGAGASVKDVYIAFDGQA